MFIKQRALTLLVAAVGSVAFWFLGMPLPLLLGPTFACLAAALMGAQLKSFGQVTVALRTILGVAVGSTVTPELVGRLGEFAISVAFVPLLLLLAGLVGYPYYRRVWGFDKATAFYSAMPGGLQDMLVFGEEAGGNPRALSLIHATRVLVIVTVLPILLATVWSLDLNVPPGQPAQDIPLQDLGIMTFCALVGWKVGERLGLFGASILGPMILTAAASLAGLLHFRPPAEAIWVAQLAIGIGIGAHYVGITMVEVRSFLVAAIGYCLYLSLLALMFAEILALGGFVPQLEALLAFAPGGQAEMTVLALVAGADMAYVVTVHLSRIVLVIIGAPLVFRLLK
ncbi:MAG: AbrB family transcriptional regulator [Pseudomonadota bacterium]